MTLKYKIKILSDWHCGSGLDSGADADLLVIKDEHGLPFIPGKTIKGLLRDALWEISEVKNEFKSCLETVFGKVNSDDSTNPGKTFFTNAEMPEVEKGGIINQGLQPYLYRNYASTAIGENGIALEHSLRTMQVCRPVTLAGEIHDVPEDCMEAIRMAMKWCRYLGSGRNRGLGRCKFEMTN
ncbi:MAG: hypothetical protein Kow0027_22830 [Saprospiraceae bacterium]